MRLICWLYERRLSALALSGEHPAPDSPLAQHIAQCAYCQQAARELGSLTGRLEGLSAPAVHVDFERGVFPQVSAASTPTPRSLAWRPAAVAALSLALPLGFWVYQAQKKQTVPQTQTASVAPTDTPAPQETPGPNAIRGSMPQQTAFVSATPAPVFAPTVAPRQQGVVQPTPVTPIQAPHKAPIRSGKRVPPTPQLSVPVQDDTAFLNGDGFEGYAHRMSALLKQDAQPFLASIGSATQGDDFVSIPAPQIANSAPNAMAEALARYEQEKAVVDARLQHKLTIKKKRISFGDLCEQISKETGIEITATRSVGDEKITIFCKDRPLRDIMRQVTRLFGFTWERSGEENQWRYKLSEPLKVRILEEELRNKDRNDALLALDREMEAFKDLLGLSPEEARAQEEGAIDPKKKERLKMLGGIGWGPAQLYNGLSSDERDSLLSGKKLWFNGDGKGGSMALPANMRDTVLKSLRGHAFVDGDSTSLTSDRDSEFAKNAKGVSPDQVPGMVPTAGLSLERTELGQFELIGHTGFGNGSSSSSSGAVLAKGVSPSAASPENAKANTALEKEPRFKASTTLPAWQEKRKLTTADLLEAIHKATGKDVIGDYFTRLYEPQKLWGKTPAPLFEVLNKACDATRLRWEEKEGFLSFRSTDFFNMRLKEVPNRLMNRWAQARQEKKQLSPDEFREITRLTDFQLDASGMAEGARALWGLDEWEDARATNLRPVWRFADSLPAPQRNMMFSEAGLRFGGLGLEAQRGFMNLLYFPGEPVRTSMENGTATDELVQRLNKATMEFTADPKRLPPGVRVGQGDKEWFLVSRSPSQEANQTRLKVVGRQSMAVSSGEPPKGKEDK